MKVLFDHQAFSVQQSGGVSRYVAELLNGLPALGFAETDLSCKYSNNRHLKEITTYRPLTFGVSYDFIGKKSILALVNNYYAFKEIKENAFDIFHPTYYDPYFLKALRGRPFVLTVHDMTHEEYPDLMHPLDKSSAYKKKLVEKSTAIIAISNHTKLALMNHWKVNEDKIHVVYHGCSFDKVEEQNLKLPENFILFVGKRGGYKNWELLIKAFASTGLKDQVALVMVGGGSISAQEKRLINHYQIPFQNVIQLNLTDGEMKNAYKRCLCFVYPSLYEGFGLPILEAYHSRAKVLLSKSSCFEEIGGKGAMYFDPNQPSDLAALIEKAYTSPQSFEPLKVEQNYICKQFTWESAVRSTYKVYEQVLKKI